jgi:hypothetical protein
MVKIPAEPQDIWVTKYLLNLNSILNFSNNFLNYKNGKFVIFINIKKAPEVLLHLDHSYTADYFAIGIITYELMTGTVIALIFISVLSLGKTEKK